MYELDIYTSGAQHLIQKSVAENMCSGFSKDKIKMKLYMQKKKNYDDVEVKASEIKVTFLPKEPETFGPG